MLYDITNNSVVSLFALVLRSHYIAGLVQLFEDGILKAPFSLMMIIIMWLPDRRSARRHAGTPLVATLLPKLPFQPKLHGAVWCKICRKGSQTCASWTLVVLKMKSNFHTENKKSCLESKLNFVFYTCLPHFTLGPTILVDIKKVRQVYVVITVKCQNKFKNTSCFL